MINSRLYICRERKKNANKKPHISVRFGGAFRIRTGDLYNANVARYQLC